ncbi:MAG: hypothetical protein ACRDVG_11805 [Jatrophihabitantaceae bacterium]
MTVSDTPMFVVVLTGDDGGFSNAPRAIGPFETFDVAQAFTQTLAERYSAEGETAPDAAVVRVEPDLPGVVVGEL